MSIAIICPIGDLNRFGYWRVAQACLQSWHDVGDLFLIHSSRFDVPFGIRAEYIRDDSTLMQVKNGLEWFDHRLIAANANRGITEARRAGYDVAITICVNWYVEGRASRRIFEKCRQMVIREREFEYLYRRIQIGDHLFDSDRRVPAAINIEQVLGDSAVKVLVDHIQIDGQNYTTDRGGFAAHNDEAYIDCEFELTVDEMKEKLADVRNYEDILIKRRGIGWEYWEDYYKRHIGKLDMSSDVPGRVGRHIVEAHPAGSLGDWMLEQLAVTA